MSPSPRFISARAAKPSTEIVGEPSPRVGIRRAISGIGQKGTEIFEKGVERGSEIKGHAVEIIEASQARLYQEASQAAVYTKEKTSEMKELAMERRMQVAVASGAGGAVVVGTPAAAGGLVVGGTIGTMLGILPALFTMGLSIPFGAAIGAGCGAAVAGSVGGAVGFSGFSFLGYKFYTKRSAIWRFWIRSRNKTEWAVRCTRDRLVSRVRCAKGRVRQCMYEARLVLATFTGFSKAKIISASKDEDVRRGAACAAGGGVVFGAGGGVAGAATGGLIGAVVGLPMAIITVGLAIPFCAVVGGGVGLVAGATVGGTVGTVGGAGGYFAWARREAIRTWSVRMAKKACKVGCALPGSARRSASDLQEKV